LISDGKPTKVKRPLKDTGIERLDLKQRGYMRVQTGLTWLRI
jgi:hypothetical protein